MKQTKHLKIWGKCTRQGEEQMKRLIKKLTQHGQGAARRPVWVMWSKKGKSAAEDVRERERRGQSMQDLLGHGQELRVDTKCDGKPWKYLSSRVTWTEQHMWKIPFTLKIQVTSDAGYAYVPRVCVLAPCPVTLKWNVPQDPSGTCKSWYTTVTLWA